MRLSSLSPQWWTIYRDFTPETGGVATDRSQLVFVCPRCGPPHRVTIYVGPTMDFETRTWQATPLPDAPDWPERVTIVPSINYTVAGHGPKHPHCTFHGSIINGEVLPA